MQVTVVSANQHDLDASPAYTVLGRELTHTEIQTHGGSLTTSDIQHAFLSHEQKLVIVRALIAVGAGNDVNRVLQVYHFSGLKTFAELVHFFRALEDKYGSVKAGIESEFVYNMTDDREAFRKAAAKAYTVVLGVKEEEQEKEQIYEYFKQREAKTFSEMQAVLLASLETDSQLKQKILFDALDEVGRSDLKTNKKFVKKILKQQFTHQQLMELLQGVTDKKPGKKKK